MEIINIKTTIYCTFNGDPNVNYPNTLPLIKNCFAIIVFIGVAKMNRLCYNNKED